MAGAWLIKFQKTVENGGFSTSSSSADCDFVFFGDLEIDVIQSEFLGECHGNVLEGDANIFQMKGLRNGHFIFIIVNGIIKVFGDPFNSDKLPFNGG